MHTPIGHLAAPIVLAAMVLAAAVPAHADDTEIFVSRVAEQGVRPNILFIMDTSGSMAGEVTTPKAPYDSATDYPGSCDRERIYWSREAAPPECSVEHSVLRASNRCAAASEALDGIAGSWVGKLAAWLGAEQRWSRLRNAEPTQTLECEADSGAHGRSADDVARYAQDGDASAPWSSDKLREIAWGLQETHTLYGGNYLNWHHAADAPATRTRLEIVQAVATSLAASIDGVNLGLMRFSDNAAEDTDADAEGGMVLHAVEDIAESRASITATLDSLTASGYTPLTETLYEAGQYLAGRAVDYGLTSAIEGGDKPLPSVAGSRDPRHRGLYRSPVEFQCQRNYVILLTDGEPTYDHGADGRIPRLPGFAAAAPIGCDAEGHGRCLPAMAEYLHGTDLSTTVPGRQYATTYTIGFGPEVAGSALLQRTAARGGGKAYSAGNAAELTQTLQAIVAEILATHSTFTTPSISLDAFNRTQALDELYVSVFEPTDSLHWPGNVKKYALRGGRIVDARGTPAVDPASGFLRGTSQSFWSDAPDGDRAPSGGAASRLPEASARRLYTHIPGAGQSALTAAVNRFDRDNPALTAAMLAVPDELTRARVIDHARGVDVRDLDIDGDTIETARRIGDPLHAQPVHVVYGGERATPDAHDAVVFVPTNDGFLHALDAASGRELWAFIPVELLGRLHALYIDPPVARRTYGLDGDVRVLKFDVNGDGIVEPGAGDRVWLYFGMRRGGRWYYAIDVTDRARPELLWKIGPDDLPGIGQTWSPPGIARVRIGGAVQNGEHLMLIIGGGYDPVQDNYGYVTDNTGNRIYMIDAASGALLWFAGGPERTSNANSGAGTGAPSRSPDLELAAMTHSIPARVSILDLDADGYADRLYAADMGGRIWRFDIWNGATRDELVTGGEFARLGASPDVTGADSGAGTGAPAIHDTRRFYSAPDVALIQRPGRDAWFNVAIGSGYRAHPLHTATRDRFYALRDTAPFTKLTQARYAATDPITEADLVDITSDPGGTAVPAGSRGWRLELRLNGGWSGEKVLAESVTVNGVILFPTWQPSARNAADPCLPPSGTNRVYAVTVDAGAPALDFDDSGDLGDADLSTELAQTGIAGEVVVGWESAAEPDTGTDEPPGSDDGGGGNDGVNGDDDTARDALGRRPLCMVGVEVLDHCIEPDAVLRTFWR